LLKNDTESCTVSTDPIIIAFSNTMMHIPNNKQQLN